MICCWFSCTCHGQAMTIILPDGFKPQSQFPPILLPQQTTLLALIVIDDVGAGEHPVTICLESAAESDPWPVTHHLDIRLLWQAIEDVCSFPAYQFLSAP